MAKEKISGIYCIENLVNGKKYIGQSCDTEKRKIHHFYLLGTNQHENPYLQNSWNKYKSESFKFFIIEDCNVEELNTKELYYINFYKTNIRDYGYNIAGGGDSLFKMNEETKSKISKAMTNNPKMCGEKNWSYGKSPKDRMSEETYDRWFKSLSKKHKPHKKHVIKNKNKRENNAGRKPKAVICINDNNVFESVKKAGEYYKIDYTCIRKCCLGNSAFSGISKDGIPLQWSYYVEDKKYELKKIDLKRRPKKITQYDLKMNKIKEYNSIIEASKDLNIDRRLISKVCRNINKTTNGYIFKYND